MPVASVQLAASSLHGSLYAIGGYSSTQFSQDSCLSSCWRYEPFLNEWKEIEDMKAPRAELGCVTLKGQVYAIGGCDGLYSLSSVEKYCPSLNTWTEGDGLAYVFALFILMVRKSPIKPFSCIG